jgi:hypothetical protein
MQNAHAAPDARLNQSGQASGAVRQQYEAGASAVCTGRVVVHQQASGTETTNMAGGRKRPSSCGG